MLQSVSLMDVLSAWFARAGDSDMSSVINTVLYAIAFGAALCRWRALTHLKSAGRESGFWLLLTLVLLALGLNKQLDFQVLLIEAGRPIALQGGWFEYRRPVLAIFALALSGLAVLFTALVVILVRRHWKNNLHALLGLLILCAYTVLEAVSQGHLSEGVEGYEKFSVRLSDLIEMTGIVLILLNAFRLQKND